MSDLHTDIILTAINHTPPQEEETQSDYQGRLFASITDIAAMVRPGSPANKVVDNILGDNSIWLTGKCVDVTFEESSQRYVVTFQTRPTDENKDGIDKLRTDRVDSVMGETVRQMLKGKKGHRCIFLKRMEKSKDGRSYRIVAYIRELD
jgi:hypothetical protein